MPTMKTSLTVMAGLLVLGGCGKTGFRGVYVGSGANTSFDKLSFRDDANVDISGMDTTAAKYSIDGSKIRVQLPDGSVIMFDIEANGCIRTNGSDFCKKSS